MESLIIKTMVDHCGELFGHDLPYPLLRKYAETMFDDEATVESVVDMAIYITNEAFYTPAPLLYSPKEMAISAVIMACKHLKLQCPLSEGYDFQAMAD